jgi:hypothetical protein
LQHQDQVDQGFTIQIGQFVSSHRGDILPNLTAFA